MLNDETEGDACRTEMIIDPLYLAGLKQVKNNFNKHKCSKYSYRTPYFCRRKEKTKQQNLSQLQHDLNPTHKSN